MTKPYRHPGAVTLLLAMLLVPACTSLTQGECEVIDWQAQGRVDGAEGHPLHRYYEHHTQCAEFGIQGDQEGYESGWELGVEEYCTRENGFYEGREGHFYHGVCPPELESAFSDAYQQGKKVRRLDEKLEELERDIDRREDRLADEDLSGQERERLRSELRELDREYRRLIRRLVRAEARFGL